MAIPWPAAIGLDDNAYWLIVASIMSAWRSQPSDFCWEPPP
jgi:hypothetical protein